ncbi:hypothetical protein RISK_002132 [Rhodopirellula islandica]|uniref:Uncharacterized protein n=1 Tax=Rhodopirellula islandica TaxID=595434 RepID=A0A0J1BG41_RHOIS|nr:hypothetical protein RISK_002132 [Rhodopirellula islandica]
MNAAKAARSAAPTIGREGGKKATGGAGMMAGQEAYSAGKEYMNSSE